MFPTRDCLPTTSRVCTFFSHNRGEWIKGLGLEFRTAHESFVPLKSRSTCVLSHPLIPEIGEYSHFSSSHPFPPVITRWLVCIRSRENMTTLLLMSTPGFVFFEPRSHPSAPIHTEHMQYNDTPIYTLLDRETHHIR